MAKKKVKVKAKAKAKKKEIKPEVDSSLVDFLAACVQKQFGKESIMKMSAGPKRVPVIFPSGIPSLDKILGIGGWPKDRIIEILGPESSGKTTLCLHACKACQDAGGVAAVVDAEHALDTSYAAGIGVRVEDLLLSQPDHGEQAFGIVETLLGANKEKGSKVPLVIVVDSVAALTPKLIVESGPSGDDKAGLGAHARLMSKSLQKLVQLTKGTNSLIIFTNQIRSKIGVTWGSKETTTGGNALKFYASVRVDIRSIGKEKEKDTENAEITGNKTRIRIIKNKIAPPFREINCMMRFGIGVDLIWDLHKRLLEEKVMKKSGAWLSIGDDRIGCGYKDFVKFYEANPDYFRGLLESGSA